MEIITVLTIGEREVLALLGRSYSNQEIAETLCLSESTVKTHMPNVFHKLRVRNRSEAIALLYGTDLIRGDRAVACDDNVPGFPWHSGGCSNAG